MTQEEKAKAYDEAIERAKKHCADYVVETIFPELKESEDEKIRKEIISVFKSLGEGRIPVPINYAGIFDWLEKQGEHANFRNNIHIGDKVTRNRDGVLVNLSQLNRVAKKDEKQGEQKSSDKIEPKFKVGDWAVSDLDKMTRYISEVHNDKYNNYYVIKGDVETERDINEYDRLHHLWTIQDAKDGDVLAFKNNIGGIIIYKSPSDYDTRSYCRLIRDNLINKEESGWDSTLLVPATKEQRNLLLQKMKEAGYEWDAKKKELRKIEQKSAWSEEDARLLDNCISLIEDIDCTKEEQNWLKSLRPQNRWKPSDEQMVALQEAMNIVGILTITGSKINSLYQDLKKLKG